MPRTVKIMESGQTRTAKRPHINSLFRHGVDEKRRVQIPARWRPIEEGVELTLLLWRKYSAGPCLRVLTLEKMDELLSYLDSLPNTEPNKTVLKRTVGSDSAQVTLDKAGRICLPEAMAAEAGITDEAVLVGLLDKFEIWNPERHARLKAADEAALADAYKLLE